MLYNYKSTFSVKTDSTEKQSLHLDLANGHDDDVVPKALRPCTVRILDTTINEEMSLPGRIHSWTTVFVSQNPLKMLSHMVVAHINLQL